MLVLSVMAQHTTMLRMECFKFGCCRFN